MGHGPRLQQGEDVQKRRRDTVEDQLDRAAVEQGEPSQFRPGRGHRLGGTRFAPFLRTWDSYRGVFRFAARTACSCSTTRRGLKK
jgi:hypothetical protein